MIFSAVYWAAPEHSPFWWPLAVVAIELCVWPPHWRVVRLLWQRVADAILTRLCDTLTAFPSVLLALVRF
ncbi:MAG: hypothetical protein ACLSHU_04550 [Oscillospiraceae bacterium]